MAVKPNVLVIDAQGGGIGKAVVASLKRNFPSVPVTAVGTNCVATSAMMKAGADRAATGDNAVIVCCRTADLIIGPIGIVIADALLGEITPEIAKAVGQSAAKRILIPINHCDNLVVGVPDLGIAGLIQGVLDEVEKILESY